MTVTLKKVGGSVAMIIPKAIASEMGLREGTAMSVTAKADEIVLRKPGRRPRRSLDAIVAQMDPAAYRRHRKLLREPPIGKEYW